MHGDAAAGCPENGLYERIVATFSVDHIPPHAWPAQTTCGGRIVTPWTSACCRDGTLALTVNEDGAAQGRFHPFASCPYAAPRPGTQAFSTQPPRGSPSPGPRRFP